MILDQCAIVFGNSKEHKEFEDFLSKYKNKNKNKK